MYNMSYYKKTIMPDTFTVKKGDTFREVLVKVDNLFPLNSVDDVAVFTVYKNSEIKPDKALKIPGRILYADKGVIRMDITKEHHQFLGEGNHLLELRITLSFNGSTLVLPEEKHLYFSITPSYEGTELPPIDPPTEPPVDIIPEEPSPDPLP